MPVGWAPIVKRGAAEAVAPNLDDYDRVRASFTWADARAALDGLPAGRGLNIAHEAVDRHATGVRADHVAIRWLGKRGEVRDYTYRHLRELTDRFANTLTGLGVGRGERVYTLAGRIPELYVTALGTLKHGSVFCPLFSAFGPEPIRARMTIGQARVLITTETLYHRKIAPLRAQLPDLAHVLLVGEGGAKTLVPETHDFGDLLARAADRFTIAATAPEDMALLHFTSGTTGKPKGAVHVHEAVVAHHVTGTYALDLHPGDVFWCTADPGWVTGTSYEIVAPLTHGLTSLVDEAEFDAERWYRTLQDHRVTVWYTAPTAIRMLMKAGADLPAKYDLRALRFLSSVGEPLNPEAVVWGQEALGRPFHDNWWQTETGGIMIANFAAMDVRPGSMGRPLPGVEAAIKAVALALREVPELNGFWRGDHAEPSTAIHVGVAISLRGGGLVAPALHDVDRRDLRDLMRAFRDLVQRARGGGLRSSELSDATITVTSLGEQGVETVFGIVYPPQLAIVGFGKVAERPWIVDGAVVARPLVTTTLAADHRVTDGHRGGLFLAAVERLLQAPERL